MVHDPAKLRQAAGQLQAGVIIRLHNPVAGKPKRHVLIFADRTRSLGFLINTFPAPFVRNDPKLLARQILMTQALHPFMHHDSYIACHDTTGLACRIDGTTGSMQDLCAAVCDGRAEILGALDRGLFATVAAAAAGSTTIAQRDALIIATTFGSSGNSLDSKP